MKTRERLLAWAAIIGGCDAIWFMGCKLFNLPPVVIAVVLVFVTIVGLLARGMCAAASEEPR
jgi:hypothetical protein